MSAAGWQLPWILCVLGLCCALGADREDAAVSQCEADENAALQVKVDKHSFQDNKVDAEPVVDDKDLLFAPDTVMTMEYLGELLSAAKCPGLWSGTMGCYGVSRVRPQGRTFLATDPTETVQFFESYLGAVRQNISSAPWEEKGCAKVVNLVLPLHDQALTYVVDFAKPNPLGSSLADLVAGKDADVRSVVTSRRQDLWSSWMNNHDGHGTTLRMIGNVTGLFATGIQCYWALFRGDLSGNLNTFEFLNNNSQWDELPAADQAMCVEREAGPDKGRNYALGAFYARQYLFEAVKWFKTTMASADPLASALFTAKYLGGVRLPSPYAKGTGALHYAEWVFFPPTAFERPFWMHFVRSNTGDETPSVYKVAEELAKARNLSADIFDKFLYNSVRFDVEDLVPFVQSFQSGNVPFLVRKTSTAVKAFVSIPGTIFAYELKSNRGMNTYFASSDWFDMCSVE